MSFGQNSIFHFFTIKFLLVTKFFPQPLTAKMIIIEGCFWYVWIGKDQNFALRTNLVLSLQIGCLRKHLARGVHRIINPDIFLKSEK